MPGIGDIPGPGVLILDLPGIAADHPHPHPRFARIGDQELDSERNRAFWRMILASSGFMATSSCSLRPRAPGFGDAHHRRNRRRSASADSVHDDGDNELDAMSRELAHRGDGRRHPMIMILAGHVWSTTVNLKATKAQRHWQKLGINANLVYCHTMKMTRMFRK